MRPSSRSLALLLAVSVSSASLPARAAGTPASAASAAAAAPTGDAASELKHQGDTLLSQKSFVEALDAYDKSYALVPNPAVHYNRGRALQFLARYPEALDAFERFEADAPPDLKARVSGLSGLIAEIRSKVATLQVLCTVPGGRVLIGGRDVGKTPLADPVRINAGHVTIEVLADGYFAFRREIDAPGGATADVDVTLVSRATLGILVVRSQIAGTSVAIDGKGVGVVPAEAALPPGTHPVVVTHDGYRDATTQVVLLAGDRKDLLLDPIRPRAITTRWWFWTIIGGAVTGVAATVLVYAALKEAPVSVGSIPPGQLRF